MENKLDDTDFLNTAVPEQERRHWVWVSAVWVGFIIVVGIMSVGGGLAGQLDEVEFIKSLIIGNVFLAMFAAFAGWIGASTGENFSLLSKNAFSDASWRLAGLYVPVVLIGWFGVEAAIFGSIVGKALDLNVLFTRVAMVGSTFAFAITCYFGFSAIRKSSMLLVPIIVFIASFAVLKTHNPQTSVFNFAESEISTGLAVSIVMNTWIMGALTCVPDLTRFCKTPLSGALVAGLGVFFANSFTLAVGGYAAASTGDHDPATILLSMGVLPLAVAFAVANIWSTNDNNMYSAALNVARMANVNRKGGVLICAGLAAVFAAFDPTQIGILFTFLGFMGGTAPALGGVVFASVLFPALRNCSTRSFPAWVGWGLGAAASYLTPAPVAIFIGFFVGGCTWLIVSRLQFPRSAQTDAN